ncbi:hypothetical protein TNCV_1986491 [Trichonephila clavipes]|nr:hypothetical protein TNCV_1986491 [Trichonephila clavipes]
MQEKLRFCSHAFLPRSTNQSGHSLPGRPTHIRPHTLSRYGMEERFAFRFPVTPSIMSDSLGTGLPAPSEGQPRLNFETKRKLDLTGASEMNRLYPNSRRETVMKKRMETARQNLQPEQLWKLKQEPALITDPNSDVGKCI